VSATGYPFLMVGAVPVIAAPAEIDTVTASKLRAVLLDWQGQGLHHDRDGHDRYPVLRLDGAA